MRKNRLIALIGTLTMAAAGLAAVSAGVSSKKAESASAATENISGTYLYIDDQAGKSWTYSGCDPVARLKNITFVENSGYSSIDDINGNTIAGGITIGTESSQKYLDVKMQWDANGTRPYAATIPWYIKSFDASFYAKNGDGERFLYQKGVSTTNRFSLSCSIGDSKKIYIFNNSGGDDSYWDGTKFIGILSIVSGNNFKYDETKYTVTTSASTGGSVSSSVSGSYYKDVIATFTASANNGYSFSKWNNDSTIPNPYKRKINLDLTLSASFTAALYNINYTTNGGTLSGTPKTSYTIEDETYILPTTWASMPEGKEFDKWTLNGDTVTTLPQGSTGDKTYVAVWKDKPAVTWTVSATPSTSGYGSISPSSITVADNSSVSISDNVITIDGKTLTATPAAETPDYVYSFTGWSGISDGGTITADTPITANFTRTNKYVVTINVVGGDYGTVDKNSVTVTDGTSISATTNVLSIGSTTVTATQKAEDGYGTYSFSGWTDIPAGGTVTGSVTVTATFIKATTKHYSLTWNLNGGEIKDETGTYTPSGDNYEYNTSITAPKNVEKEGFRFTGWDKTVSSKLTADSTYTAQWTRLDGYYVHVYGTNERFISMSGTGEVSAVVSLADQETFKVTHVVDGVETSWHGFTELKFDSGADACDARTKAQIIDDGTNDHNMKANLPETNSYTVYYKPAGDGVTDPGIYIPSIVNVQFDLNGVTGEGPENQIVNSRGLVTEPADPTTELSYTFDGWYHEAGCTTPWDFSTHQVIYFDTDSEHVATTKIYAKWVSTAKVDITLNNNGGTGGLEKLENVGIGDAISVPTANIPEKLNNTFTGYFTPGGTKVINADGTNNQPYQESFGATLNAGWTLNAGTYLWVKGDASQDGARKMTLNGETGTQYVWKNITLAANDEIRCYYENGNYGNVNSITWSHPDYQGVKEGDNCKVLVAGTYDIYYDTTSGEMHLTMPTMPENGRYLAINGDTSKSGLKLMERHSGYTGTEYKYEGYFAKGQAISAYYQDATQDTEYYPTLSESVKAWDYEENVGLICPESGTYSIYLISEDKGTTYNKISIFQEGEADAVNFAKNFDKKMHSVCKAPEGSESWDYPWDDKIATAWAELKEEFDAIKDTRAKTYLKTVGPDSSNKYLAYFASFYDYVYSKYDGSEHADDIPDFIGRFQDGAGQNLYGDANHRLISVSDVSTSTWIIAVTAFVGIAAVGVFFIYRKRKEN